MEDSLMKTLAMLILALVSFVSPQGPSTPRPARIDGAPDVSIPGIMLWGKDEPGSATFAIQVKNNSKRLIKGISWEHTLSFPSGRNKVNLSLDLTSGDLYLRPGEDQLVLSPINKIFDSAVAKIPPERIRLMKVEYEDGSSWRRSDDGAK
jgi:hypothetical protein